MESAVTNQSNQGDFWHHRSFKIIVGYFVGAWTFLEFLGFVLQRFNISPYWSAVFLDLLLLLIPAILVVSFAPREGKKTIVLMRRWIIPTNALIAIMIVGFLFWGKDLGATTKTVYYEDENGQNHPLKVQKEEFATKIIFENFQPHEELKEEDKWLASGIRRGTGFSLKQIRKVYAQGTSIKKPMLKAILEELKYENFDYFLSGTVNKVSDSIYLELAITKSDGTQESIDPLIDINPIELIDKANNAILKKLDIKHGQVLLPFRDIGTDSKEAFEAWGQGDVTGAIEKDSTFMLAWEDKLYVSIYQKADEDFLNRIAQTSIKHINKLPERLQGYFKTLYWYALGEYGKCESSIEKQLKLNPSDSKILDQKVFLHTYMGNLGKVNEALVIKLKRTFNEQDLLHALGNYLILNELDEFDGLINQYGDQMNPTRKALVEAMAALQKSDYELARQKKDEVLLLDPSIEFAEKFEEIIEYNRNLSDDKRNEIYKSLSGELIFDRGKQRGENRMMNDLLVRVHGGIPRIVLHLTDSTSLSYLSLGRNIGWTTFEGFVNENGEVSHVDFSNSYRLYRITDGLGKGLDYFNKGEYVKADSLLRQEFAMSGTYFIENYLKAITYQQSPDGTLLEDLEGMKLVRPNGEFVCMILREDDHLEFEFNGSINRVYPAPNSWLVNLDSRRNKYKVSYTSDGVRLDRYEWNQAKKDYDKKNAYLEFKPSL